MTCDAERVKVNIRASKRYWRSESDLPDPLGYLDVVERPELVAAVLERRVAAGNLVGQPRAFPIPKAGARTLRRMTVLDPYSQLIYRMAVERVSARCDAALPPAVVHTRLAHDGVTFRSLPWKDAHRRKREFLAEHSENGCFAGYGQADVKVHYPSVKDEAIERAVLAAGNSAAAVAQVVDFLRVLRDTPGSEPGLPIGPEASAHLGTAVLRPLDILVGRYPLPYLRYVDDVTVFCSSPQEFHRLAEEMAGQLALIGQALNHAKTEFVETGSANEFLSLSSLEEAGGLSAVGGQAGPTLEEALDRGDAPRVRFLLGGLRHDCDPTGIRLLAQYRWAIRELPKQVAQYLDAVRTEIREWAWIHEEVLAVDGPETAAASMHGAALLRHAEIPASVGEGMFDLALSLPGTDMVPLRAMLFAAAARSQERGKIRSNRAADLILECPDFLEMRSLLGSLKDIGTLNRQGSKAVRHAARIAPDLEPTASWVLAS